MTQKQAPSNQQRYLSNMHPMVATSVKMRIIMFCRRSLGVGVSDSAVFCPYLLLLVVSVGDAVIPNDEAAKPGFGSLKDTLSVVCTTYTVGFKFGAENSSLTTRLENVVVIAAKITGCPLPGKRFGRIPSFTAKRQRRAESPVRCDTVCPHFTYCTQRWISFSKLEVIERRLRSFPVAAEPQRLANPAQDVGRVLGLLKDLGEIIFDYQVR